MTETARIDAILANQAKILSNLDACLAQNVEPVSNESWGLESSTPTWPMDTPTQDTGGVTKQ